MELESKLALYSIGAILFAVWASSKVHEEEVASKIPESHRSGVLMLFVGICLSGLPLIWPVMWPWMWFKSFKDKWDVRIET